MKYAAMLNGWKERREAIFRHYLQTRNFRSTGRAFDITGERVRQIVEKEQAKDGQDHPRGSDTAPAVGAAVDG